MKHHVVVRVTEVFDIEVEADTVEQAENVAMYAVGVRHEGKQRLGTELGATVKDSWN